jgi:predicted negative regulator of RcsB-dependent stress response
MAFDLQEQEQIDSLRAFWHQWGKWIAAAVGVLALGYLGYKGYGLYQQSQADRAALVYAQVETAAQSGDLTALKRGTSEIEAGYAGTGYASRAALLAAKVAFDKGDSAFTRQQLGWVVKNGKEPLVALAHLRLASVLLDAREFPAALAELNAAHPAEFDSPFFDLKGDVAVARNDNAAARDAYKAALAKLSGDSPERQYIQTKLDALGG